MSYNVPGQDSGLVRTDPPSTPCSGDFVEKLNCSQYGWFFWLVALCVVVLFCVLCSSCVVDPLIECWRERREDRLMGVNLEAGAPTTRQHGDKNNEPPPRSFGHNFHHWYLNRVLKITLEDRKEFGPSTFDITTTGIRRHGSSTSPGSGSSSFCSTIATSQFTGAVNQIVDDPGVGAEATARGGGWMGAENGRL